MSFSSYCILLFICLSSYYHSSMAKAIDEPVLEPQRTDLKSGDLEEVIRDVERVQQNL